MSDIRLTYGNYDSIKLAEETRNQAEMIVTDWDKRAVSFDDINPDSIVVEVGGYRGCWAYRMAVRYNPHLYIFEPQPWGCEVMKELLKDYKAHIYPYALGTKSGSFPTCKYETDGCSFEKTISGERRTLKLRLPMRNMNKEFKIVGLEHIDVMHMNIEGGEKTLIPHMLKNKIFPRIFLFQHHDLVSAADIYSSLGDYYNIMYDYGTALSAWKYKEA